MSHLFVLIGGWPGSGKTTLAAPLARELGLQMLAKDDIKAVLMDSLGPPRSVPESQRLGRAAVRVLLHVAASQPGAVLDSTWFDYTVPLVQALPGRVVEVRCVVPVEIAQARYRNRSDRHPGHLDALRADDELWGGPAAMVGLGREITVDTTGPVDIPGLAAAVLDYARV